MNELHSIQQAAEAALAKKYGFTRSIYYFMLNTLSTIRRKPRMNEAFMAIESVTVNILVLHGLSNIDQ